MSRPRFPVFPFPGSRFRRAAFSLLELLGVVLVCFILWSFLFPAAESMVRNRRRRQAETEVQSIASALLAYHREYGHYPGEEAGRPCDAIYLPVGGGCGNSDMDLLEPELLYRALCVSDDADRLALNPRQIMFLEENPSRTRDDVLLDPWGDPYVVVVDADENGWIGQLEEGNAMTAFSVTASAAGGERSHEVPGRREPVYVFSWGGSHTTPITSAREVR